MSTGTGRGLSLIVPLLGHWHGEEVVTVVVQGTHAVGGEDTVGPYWCYEA